MPTGLEEIIGNTGPLGGAYFAGQREADLRRTNDLSAIINAQKINQSEKMNPLLVDQQGLQNEGLAAELPGKRAQSRSLGVTANVDEALQDSKIYEKMSESQLRSLTTMGETGRTIASQLINVPEVQRPAAAMQLMRQARIDPNSEAGQHILNTPAEKLLADSQRLTQTSSSYLTKLMEKNKDLEREGVQQRGATERERMGIDAGKYKKNGAQVSLMSQLPKLKVDERLGIIKGILDTGKLPGTTEDVSPIEMEYFKSVYAQDIRTKDAKLAAQAQAANQGITAGVGPSGEVSLQQRSSLPSVGEQSQTAKPQLSSQDQQAVEWAKSNPKDPRAKRILQLHGM